MLEKEIEQAFVRSVSEVYLPWTRRCAGQTSTSPEREICLCRIKCSR